MNIKFSYLYRDASNYKQHKEIVFANPNNLPVQEVQIIIRNNLLDGRWFIAKDWNLPDLHFKEYSWDNDVDHEWHEFECVEETAESKTIKISIEEFIEAIVV